jgi:DNA mismatch endonuclease (patch repair protein)
MSSVRQSATSPELTLRRALHRLGFRFRLNVASMPGKPDVVLPRYGVALFVHGCFWHGHGCRAGRAPATRGEYWLPKLAENRRRDRRKAAALRRLGWRVMTVWECGLRTQTAANKTVRRVANFIDRR